MGDGGADVSFDDGCAAGVGHPPLNLAKCRRVHAGALLEMRRADLAAGGCGAGGGIGSPRGGATPADSGGHYPHRPCGCPDHRADLRNDPAHQPFDRAGLGRHDAVLHAVLCGRSLSELAGRRDRCCLRLVPGGRARGYGLSGAPEHRRVVQLRRPGDCLGLGTCRQGPGADRRGCSACSLEPRGRQSVGLPGAGPRKTAACARRSRRCTGGAGHAGFRAYRHERDDRAPERRERAHPQIVRANGCEARCCVLRREAWPQPGARAGRPCF